MTIGEFFLAIAVTGAGAASKSLGSVKEGMDGLVSSSVQAKAAIAAAIYGLERLTGMASQTGMDLYKFAATTGLSTQELQKWQYAAMKFDVSGKEMESTITGVQSAMSDMMMGKGAPEAMGLLSDAVGFDQTKARDTFYVMSKIQEFIKKMPVDAARSMAKSFGITDNVFQMLRTSNKKDREALGNRILSPKEIERLRQVNLDWKDFWFELQTMGTKFVASDSFGAFFSVVKELGNAGIDLAKAFSGFFEKLMSLPGAATAILAPFTAIKDLLGAIGKMFEYLGSQIDKFKAGKEIFSGMFSGGIGNFFSKAAAGANADPSGLVKQAQANTRSYAGMASGGFNIAAPPAMPAGMSPGQVSNNQTNNITISGVANPNDHADAVSRAVNRAARQIGSQAEGSNRRGN